MGVAYNEIPNNVGLEHDKKLHRNLTRWLEPYHRWWAEIMGPALPADAQVYLRTAVGAGSKGWDHWGFTRPADYRWGIFLDEKEDSGIIGFGDTIDRKVSDELPGEHRSTLRRIIDVQADTEPGSVEQQRQLAYTAPSLYDLRNLIQVNVEEGRHLWAMVYLLHKYFGRDGEDVANELLERRSGSADKPRVLTTFNDPINDWLSFYCFTHLTDRDGKFQLAALAESGFLPLRLTTRFMLREEAHHLAVGQTGLARIVEQSAHWMKTMDTDDIWNHGIPLSTIQRYINGWYASSLDLFGHERGTSAANLFSAGMKGRAFERLHYKDHTGTENTIDVVSVEDGKLVTRTFTHREALNEVMREDYITDARNGVKQLNGILEKAGVDFRFTLPHKGFNRRVGNFGIDDRKTSYRINPDGNVIDVPTWNRQSGEWLPTSADREQVQRLMKRVIVPGQYATWIAPPRVLTIKDMPLDAEFVKGLN